MANAKKRSHLFEREPETQGILYQAHPVDRGIAVLTVPGGRTRGLGHETNPLVVPDGIGADARPFRKLAYPHRLVPHYAILDAPRNKSPGSQNSA
jgi:hypothetical protein